MTPDGAAAVLRMLGLVAVFQAVGGAVFIGCFGHRLERALPAVRRCVATACIGGIGCVAAHEFAQAGRFTGEFSGMWDPDMLRLAWISRGGASAGLQIAGLALIGGSLLVSPRSAGIGVLAATGAMLATVAFAATGHTSVQPWRAVLAPLLIVHVTIGACWFGALGPLWIMVRREPETTAVSVLTDFSAWAGWVVPGLALAGVAIAWGLVPGVSVLRTPYGWTLMFKAAAFAVLMVLAACNRWRWVPALAGRGGERAGGGEDAAAAAAASQSLRRSIAAEIVFITSALAATALLTTYLSPH